MNINKPADRWVSLPGMKNNPDVPGQKRKELRLPLIGFLPNKVRNHFIAMAGEFAGTFLFLFFAFAATQVANASNAGGDSASGTLSQVPNANSLMYISLAFGFSLAVNAWVFFRISGGLFNPAVTLGMALIGAVTWTRAGLIFIAQILGAIAASGVVYGLYPGPMNVSTGLAGGTTIVQGLFIEMFLTTLLVFTIFMLAAEKHKGSLNPARSFGPAVVLGKFPGYHWIYWLGPFLGSLLAVAFYRFVKMLEYETANPGQDFNEKEAEVFEFDEENAATGADVARPIVQIGNPDYVADKSGLRRNASPSESFNRARTSAGSGGPDGGYGASPGINGRVDGNGAGRTSVERPVVPNATGAAAIPLGSDRPRTDFSSDAAYRNGPSAEAGSSGQVPLGGNYRMSGL
ncbi:hypothetical protein LTR08_007713 [Meristemomyces frigidus]|nr:hypothetical protein LTR08_007713 [Meristemomyces frigidus]